MLVLNLIGACFELDVPCSAFSVLVSSMEKAGLLVDHYPEMFFIVCANICSL